MNRTVKGIIIGGGVLVLLGGAIAVLLLTGPGDESSSGTDSALEGAGTVLWQVESDSINHITVKQPEGDGFSVYRKMETELSEDTVAGTEEIEVANYYLEGYDDLPMDTTTIRTLATRSATVTAAQMIEEHAADLAKYGLDHPVEVTFSVDDAEDIVFQVGDISPLADYTYLKMADSDSVYTVSSSNTSIYTAPLTDYLSKQLTEEQDDSDDEDEVLVVDMLVERKDLDYNFHFVEDPEFEAGTQGGSLMSLMMEEPVEAPLSPEKSEDTIYGLYGLTAEEIVKPHPEASDLQSYGLDDPQIKVTMKTSDGKTDVFSLGATYETEGDTPTTCYYGMLDSIGCVYGFSKDDMVYDDITPFGLTTTSIVNGYVWDIGEIRYTAGDIKLDFTGKGTSSDDYILQLNGEEADTERFRLLYTFFLKTALEGLVFKDEQVQPQGEPLAEVFVRNQDEETGKTYTFYEADSMQAYIAIDGEVRFLCRKSFVTALVHNIEIYHTDEEFQMTW